MGKHWWTRILFRAFFSRISLSNCHSGSTRRIEPYSLRETRDGNIILHAWNVDKNEHRSTGLTAFRGHSPQAKVLFHGTKLNWPQAALCPFPQHQEQGLQFLWRRLRPQDLPPRAQWLRWDQLMFINVEFAQRSFAVINKSTLFPLIKPPTGILV